MNIANLHDASKTVSTKPFSNTISSPISAIQILAGQRLREHITHIPAVLVCITGQVIFENEEGFKKTLHVGDYVEITPLVVHWVDGEEDSQLLLIK